MALAFETTIYVHQPASTISSKWVLEAHGGADTNGEGYPPIHLLLQMQLDRVSNWQQRVKQSHQWQEREVERELSR